MSRQIAVETPMRHSCDRCHSQKLRCVRASIENTGACIRCQRKHVQCIYSFSLPKGRPNVYKPIDADRDPPSTPLQPLTSPPPTSPGATAGQSTIGSIKPSCISGIPGLLMDWQLSPKNATEDTDPGWAGPVPVQASPDRHDESQHTDGRGSVSEASSSGTDPDIIIGQLSQLSIRLSRLCHLAEELASPSRSSIQSGQERDWISSEPLIDAAAFDSVASWLTHGPTGISSFESTRCPNARPTQERDMKTPGGILYYLFSASHFMLDILRDLHPTAGAMPTTGPSPMEPNPFDNVIRHLCISCHSSLMNVYISVLDVLGHDAKLSTQADRAALGDIRLVSIVQICSYLTERQNQAIDLYLSNEDSTAVSSWQDSMAISDGPVMQSTDTSIRDDMRCLKFEVQQRLSDLQQILCF
ncbi:hypothetical protein N7491_001570 [Penicillium cf. griseofulvum]|uniref:Zn(2)-C6 fungal-type domain-containing protein n=1 Tax=Penicillium cf. griseofulvum TaxID=2972120 RepID=A0A9W9JBW7_9EURO|nr:hypothetical protein N7472_006700 [Penicillium cf. griseofulvum]KAJ5445488.1 hypothetical protein N7491_001570 [Penicillium cf. griseofulvum]KAJ5447208.1 hypothetical protein N7445_002029 [Penicillium cf. griseofulvum]